MKQQHTYYYSQLNRFDPLILSLLIMPILIVEDEPILSNQLLTQLTNLNH